MKVHFQQQCEHSECGLACVSMIIDYFTKKTKLSSLREQYGVPNGGYNLLQLQTVLSENGVTSKAVKIDAKSVKAVPLPFIAFWDQKHFVIIEKITSKHILIIDPAIGKKKVMREEFEEHFSGIALYVTNNGHRKIQLSKVHPVILKIAKKNIILLLLTLIISIIMQCLSLVIPYAMQYIIDRLEFSKVLVFKSMLIIIILLFLNYFTFNLIRTRVITRMQTTFDKNFLSTTIIQLLDLPYSYFVNRSKGELIYRINSNSYIRQILIDQMIELIIDIIFFFLYLFAMFFYSVKLAIFTIIIAFILCFFSYINAKVNRKIQQNEIVVLTKAQDMINEIVNNIFTIKSTNSQRNMYCKWEDNFDKQVGLEKEKAKCSSILSNMTQTIQTFYSLFIIFGGYVLVCQQEITLGGVIAFSTIGVSFLKPILSIMNSYSQILMIKLYLERLLDILDTPNESSLMGDKNPSNYKGEITLENVSYKYSEFSPLAVSDVCLKINPYEKVAIVGASGSGKSTLLKVMSCLYLTTSGNVYYDDYNVKELNIHKLREKIGIVLQESCLFKGTFRENITMGRDFTEEDILKNIQVTKLGELVNSFPLGLETNISESGQNLSGGQRQKVAIARTIISNPSIIFLDEPTSALDNESEKTVMEYLLNIKATMVVVAHRLSTIEKFDKIIVMDNGKIVETGSHNELMKKNDYYARLYNISL
ncbi:ABC-type bacteriocin/lantibiotic exporter with double-glycine peptidase domain [Lachnotalea glycerini]|uniref:ABC-type bacteriocin/lantibiotic exporter with double-glycine peptidase domain n=1 Tax=Lachnotalea glycerini TaxID=1763509 RepID=A0A318EQ16_9FIRM|nr:peptidase domain-containing ABC transporter [Lachnotalea glycerini]PXV91684.1 ABC-type bacteriocin/lantibiotic exporter with double-glycine peptidase domain [Lachnotalea glycerini]